MRKYNLLKNINLISVKINYIPLNYILELLDDNFSCFFNLYYFKIKCMF